jgi:hypothetical protein
VTAFLEKMDLPKKSLRASTGILHSRRRCEVKQQRRINIHMTLKNPLKRSIVAATVAACAVPLLIASACNLSESYGTSSTSSSNSPNQKKVCICHHAGHSGHRKTLCLPPPAANAHLRQHDDTPGPCS